MPTLKEASRDIKASIRAARGNLQREPLLVSHESFPAAEDWAMAQAKRILESAFSEIGNGLKKRPAPQPTLILETVKAV